MPVTTGCKTGIIARMLARYYRWVMFEYGPSAHHGSDSFRPSRRSSYQFWSLGQDSLPVWWAWGLWIVPRRCKALDKCNDLTRFGTRACDYQLLRRWGETSTKREVLQINMQKGGCEPYSGVSSKDVCRGKLHTVGSRFDELSRVFMEKGSERRAL